MGESDQQRKPSDVEIIAAFSEGAPADDRIPTRQPHAPFLTNEQIIWVVRRFLAGSARSAGATNMSDDDKKRDARNLADQIERAKCLIASSEGGEGELNERELQLIVQALRTFGTPQSATERTEGKP